MKIYAAILSIRPMMETMEMAGGTFDHVNNLLQGGTDFAIKSPERLPTTMHETYYQLGNDDFGSVDALLDHLDDLHERFYSCYTYIVQLYGIPLHDDTRPIVNHRNTPVHTQRHRELRSTTPPCFIDLSHRLLHGHKAVERKIDLINHANQSYKLNLSILYHRFQIKVASNDDGVDGFHDMDQGVVDAFWELANIFNSNQMPIQTNPRYLRDIARFRRVFVGKSERVRLQRVYEWVAGSSLTVKE